MNNYLSESTQRLHCPSPGGSSPLSPPEIRLSPKTFQPCFSRHKRKRMNMHQTRETYGYAKRTIIGIIHILATKMSSVRTYDDNVWGIKNTWLQQEINKSLQQKRPIIVYEWPFLKKIISSLTPNYFPGYEDFFVLRRPRSNCSKAFVLLYDRAKVVLIAMTMAHPWGHYSITAAS